MYEELEDVADALGRGRGGERDEGHAGQLGAQLAERRVVWAKVVPPLRDTMRLINGKEADLIVMQTLQKIAHHQPFRRHIQQLQFTLGKGF